MIIHFIRHGEPDYSEIKMTDPIWYSNYAGLTQKGIEQANNVNLDVVKNSEIIISSPYTRTMHTASIISKNTNIDLLVNNSIYEWNPDKTNSTTIKDFYEFNKLFKQNPYCLNDNYECIDEMKIRLSKTLSQLKKQYNEIIIVSHQRVMSTVINKELQYCELYTLEF